MNFEELSSYDAEIASYKDAFDRGKSSFKKGLLVYVKASPDQIKRIRAINQFLRKGLRPVEAISKALHGFVEYGYFYEVDKSSAHPTVSLYKVVQACNPFADGTMQYKEFERGYNEGYKASLRKQRYFTNDKLKTV